MGTQPARYHDLATHGHSHLSSCQPEGWRNKHSTKPGTVNSVA
jgi:hypothetical protein